MILVFAQNRVSYDKNEYFSSQNFFQLLRPVLDDFYEQEMPRLMFINLIARDNDRCSEAGADGICILEDTMKEIGVVVRDKARINSDESKKYLSKTLFLRQSTPHSHKQEPNRAKNSKEIQRMPYNFGYRSTVHHENHQALHLCDTERLT